MQRKISLLAARYPDDSGSRKQTGNHTLESIEGNLIFPFFFTEALQLKIFHKCLNAKNRIKCR